MGSEKIEENGWGNKNEDDGEEEEEDEEEEEEDEGGCMGKAMAIWEERTRAPEEVRRETSFMSTARLITSHRCLCAPPSLMLTTFSPTSSLSILLLSPLTCRWVGG